MTVIFRASISFFWHIVFFDSSCFHGNHHLEYLLLLLFLAQQGKRLKVKYCDQSLSIFSHASVVRRPRLSSINFFL